MRTFFCTYFGRKEIGKKIIHAMENQINKPPKSAMAYYIKLFCKKKQNISSRDTCCIQKALKSWMALSSAERQPFIDKFKQCQETYKENCATYLRTVEPFLKKKVLREKSNDDTCRTEPEANDHENNTDNVSNADSLHNHLYTASVIDSDAGEPRSEQTLNYATEKSPSLPEPTPPFMKNGKELFEAVHKTTEDDNVQWKDLSRLERGKYQSAVHAIKRDYIKNYHKYLESLSSKELFQHYIKSLEKYWSLVLFTLGRVSACNFFRNLLLQFGLFPNSLPIPPFYSK